MFIKNKSTLFAILWSEVNKHYGVTYGVRHDVINPNVGFMVSKAYRELSAPMPTTFTHFADLLDGYTKGFADELQMSDTYLGLWYNKEDGKLYFDISEQFTTYEEALKVGSERAQLAIYDNELKDVIWL